MTEPLLRAYFTHNGHCEVPDGYKVTAEHLAAADLTSSDCKIGFGLGHSLLQIETKRAYDIGSRTDRQAALVAINCDWAGERRFERIVMALQWFQASEGRMEVPKEVGARQCAVRRGRDAKSRQRVPLGGHCKRYPVQWRLCAHCCASNTAGQHRVHLGCAPAPVRPPSTAGAAVVQGFCRATWRCLRGWCWTRRGAARQACHSTTQSFAWDRLSIASGTRAALCKQRTRAAKLNTLEIRIGSKLEASSSSKNSASVAGAILDKWSDCIRRTSATEFIRANGNTIDTHDMPRLQPTVPPRGSWWPCPTPTKRTAALTWCATQAPHPSPSYIVFRHIRYNTNLIRSFAAWRERKKKNE